MRQDEPKTTIELLAEDAHFVRGWLKEGQKWDKRLGRPVDERAERILAALEAAGIVGSEVQNA
jgi:hypothetical protein